MARNRRKLVKKALPPEEEPPKRHYIVEWAERRGMRQVDIVEAIDRSGAGIDKGTVSRWFTKGTMPQKAGQEALAAILKLDDVAALFRHPDEDWIAKFFRDKSEDERHRARQMLEAAFPRKRA